MEVWGGFLPPLGCSCVWDPLCTPCWGVSGAEPHSGLCHPCLKSTHPLEASLPPLPPSQRTGPLVGP